MFVNLYRTPTDETAAGLEEVNPQRDQVWFLADKASRKIDLLNCFSELGHRFGSIITETAYRPADC